MSEMRILFVDDDEGQQDLLQAAIDDWNEDNAPKKFVPVMCSTASEAWDALTIGRFDCALFDLKLPAEDGPGVRLTGNDLAKAAVTEYGIPAGVISGEPQDFESPSDPPGLMRSFAKGPAASERALAWIAGFWDMMTVLSDARRRIRRAEADVFLKRLWSQWAQYSGLRQVDGERLGVIVTRQFASHIAETVGVEADAEQGWHPFESWVAPPFPGSKLATGDIVRRDDGLWVILTPPCDMAGEKVDSIIMAFCDPDLPDKWADKVKSLSEGIGKGEVSNSLKSFFTGLINQKSEASKHFLPPLNGRSMVVDFMRLSSVSLTELKADPGSRVATVATAFLPNLTQRFGAYFSRTGQPNIDVDFFAH